MAAVRPVIQYDLNRDIQAVQAMASRLDPFVYENETYGSMPADLPKLTIGRLLMRLHRLSRLGNLLSGEQRERLHTAQQLVDKVKREWLTALTMSHSRSRTVSDTRAIVEMLNDQGGRLFTGQLTQG
ncbi:MAG: hypothetical protein ACYDEO_27190 [Aggregatilineales bacterium]